MRSTIAVLMCAFFALGAQAGEGWTQTEQNHAIRVDEVWQSVGEESDAESAQRAQIIRVLRHPVARDVARGHGLDLKAAEDAVHALDGTELQQLSARAAAAESQLSGGHTVITTTTLIIILLIVIILLLIV